MRYGKHVKNAPLYCTESFPGECFSLQLRSKTSSGDIHYSREIVNHSRESFIIPRDFIFIPQKI